MEADLDDSVGAPRGLYHFSAFVNGNGERLLHKDVLTGLARLNHLDGVPVVGRGDDYRVYVLALQHLAEVAVQLHLVRIRADCLSRAGLWTSQRATISASLLGRAAVMSWPPRLAVPMTPSQIRPFAP